MWNASNYYSSKKRGTQSSYHQTVREARICHDAPRHVLRPAGLEFFIWFCRWVNTFEISHAANYWSAILGMQAFDDLFSWLHGFPHPMLNVRYSMFTKWAYMASLLTYVDIRNSNLIKFLNTEMSGLKFKWLELSKKTLLYIVFVKLSLIKSSQKPEVRL